MSALAFPTPAAAMAELRALMVERFPGGIPDWQQSGAPVVPVAAPVGGGRALRTGVASWDALTGGLRLGQITEICGGLGGAGVLLDGLLARGAESGWLGGWVDVGGTLEVADWAQEALGRMVWVRCEGVLSAMKAVDLLLRDGNTSWVILDLQGVSRRSLGGISGSTWHRLHRLVEQRENALVVVTPEPRVEGVRVRIAVEGMERVGRGWTLEDLELPRSGLREGLWRGENRVRVYVRGRTPSSEPSMSSMSSMSSMGARMSA
jgi:hypothetical protein